jgi:hypothetical protein
MFVRYGRRQVRDLRVGLVQHVDIAIPGLIGGEGKTTRTCV